MNDNQKIPFGSYPSKRAAKEAQRSLPFPTTVVHIRQGVYALKRT